jgi:hypothetical protein
MLVCFYRKSEPAGVSTLLKTIQKQMGWNEPRWRLKYLQKIPIK